MSNFNDPTPIATSEQYRAALLATRQRMTDIQLKILQAHCHAPGHASSIDRIAESVGLPNASTARAAYGKFAHMIADEVKYVPGMVGVKPMWLHTLAYGRPDATGKADGQYEWIMRPELVAALQAMKWA